jgi:hypothetical protein
MLNHQKTLDEPHKEGISEAQKYLEDKYQQLADQHHLKEKGGQTEPPVYPELQEVKLISDQLKWLFTISENLKKLIRTL